MKRAVILILVLLIAVVAIFWVKGKQIENISSFTECVEAGYPVMESYPRQCSTSDGKHFTEEVEVLKELPSFVAQYISALEWPPKVEIIESAFNCEEVSQAETVASTTRREIAGRAYCVTQSSEAAAGSMYTEYKYSTALGNKTLVLSFTTRMVQCGNFPEVEMKECELERETFNLDALIDEVVQTHL